MKKLILIAVILGLVGGSLANAEEAPARGLRLGPTISGDTNCDGRVLATDALATLRIVTGIDPELTVREVCKP